MTNPLSGSPGNSGFRLPSVEKSSNGNQHKADGDGGDNINDNDFGKLVRQLGSEPKSSADGKQQAAKGSGDGSANPNSKPVRSGSAAMAGKLATSQDFATNVPEAGEETSTLESTASVSADADGEVLLGSEKQDQKLVEPGTRDDKRKTSETDGPVREAIQQKVDGVVQPELADVDTVNQDDVSSDGEEDAQSGEQVAPKASDLETEAVAAADEDSPIVASTDDSSRAESEDVIAAVETGLVSGLNGPVANPTDKDVPREPGAKLQVGENVEPRYVDGPRTTSPGRPDLTPDQAVRSLEGTNPARVREDQPERSSAGNERVVSELPGGVNKSASTSGLTLDIAAKTSAEANASPQLQSQIRLVDGQPRTARAALGAGPTISDLTDEQTAERPSTISSTGLGSAGTDLAKLLNERRLADGTPANPPAKPSTSNGASPVDAGLVTGDDEAIEVGGRNGARDDALQTRPTTQVGVQADRSMLETAMNVSRQLSQGVASNLSMLMNSGASNLPGGTTNSSAGEFTAGRSLPGDFDIRLNTPAPGAIRSLQLQLQPVSLGTVTAHLTMKNDELHVRFVVEKAETNELIQSQRNLLLAQLVEAGVEVSAANVEVETAKVSTARSTAFAGGEFGSYGNLTGGDGSRDSQNRRADSERDGVVDQAPIDEDGAAGETAGLTNQRPSVVYL